MKKIMLFSIISALSFCLIVGCEDNKKEPDSQDVSKVETSQTVTLDIKKDYDSYSDDESFSVLKVNVIAQCPKGKKLKDYVKMGMTTNKNARSVLGRIGSPIDIHIISEIKDARIVFEYDPSNIGGAELKDLMIIRVKENNSQEYIDNVVINIKNNTVSTSYTGKGTYLLADKSVSQQMWDPK